MLDNKSSSILAKDFFYLFSDSNVFSGSNNEKSLSYSSSKCAFGAALFYHQNEFKVLNS
jgi:hypothetical protein